MPAKKKSADNPNSLDAIMQKANKDIGEATVMKLSDAPLDVPRVSSGNLGLDIILGGGYPRGRIVEGYGPHGSGKSGLALMMAAEVQKLGLKVVYVDVENSLDRKRAENLGVNVDDMYIGQPPNGEMALELIERALEADDCGAIVVDSVAAMQPEAILQGGYDDAHVGRQGKMMSQGLGKINNAMTERAKRGQESPVVFFVNQIRSKIGGMSFGPSTTTSGGMALPFYASVRLEVVRTEMIKSGSDIVGHKVKITTRKNRVAPPFQSIELDMLYDRGISNGSSVLDLGIKYGLIAQNGSWYAVVETGEKLGQGRVAAINAIEADPNIESDLSSQVRAIVESL